MEWKSQIEPWLSRELGLHLKVSATEIAPTRRGLPFLGYRILPDRIRLGRRALHRFRGHLWRFCARWEATGDWEQVRRSWDSVHGYAGLAHARSLRAGILEGWHSS